ncbi:transcriptional regulator [Actinorhabdospora filicis]|uniref:Transcriptional regulator n=1 Tax=Actinorhabdospora filicis TaxID=1785913 RepID=A0A9W6W8Q5_9ACTN|nr:hypothetical protein [Actinorhabdospora filicis]GLZ77809.1 transcriptional regulator [Actinorhabdospora filicis]
MPLEALGLTPDEARMYAAAAPRRAVTVADLAQLTGLGPQRAREVADALTERGLFSPGGDDIVVAAPPDIAGEALLLRRYEELNRARAELAALTEAFRERPGASVGEFMELMPGPAVGRRWAQIQSSARAEVVIVDAPPYAGEAPPYTGGPPPNPTQIERLSSRVAYRTVYCRRGLEMYGGFERARAYVAAGEQARVLDHVGPKFAIVDGRYGMVPLYHELPARNGGALLIHRSPLLEALSAHFEMLWMCALPLDTERESALSIEDRGLLTLLLSGLTDDAICRQLGVARRTVVRRVRALMDLAGAATRMQLGWQAAQLGWVTAPWRADGMRRTDIPARAKGE